jgi:phosphatidylserine synthase
MADDTVAPHRYGGLRHILFVFLYLWALFGLFVLSEGIVSREHSQHLVFQGFALINALALTMVLMSADNRAPPIWLSARPKVVTIVFEAALCTLFFLVVHVLQRVLVGLFRGESPSVSMPSFGGGGLAGVLIVALIFFVALLPFFTFKAVAGALGGDRIWEILFRSPKPTA